MCNIKDQDGNVVEVVRILNLIEAIELLPNDVYLYKDQDGRWSLLDDYQKQISIEPTLEKCLIKAGYMEK